MSTAIKVENLSKAYQLGTIGTGTLSRDLERWIARMRGKEDPFLTIGEANDRSVKGTSDVVLSLNNISFDIEQGDAVGIIGRNGAGKSTLLKLLSRVTSPTTGSIKVKGRIASLLEVGTGFHPELTGRENIFLNGAILGMRKKEIARKFDQIVDFAGVERYIDTPVKRYSSGMYVRLAFAVAAHLESEILIVDEVLAVGDADFQKKCLGKMGEVSKGEGRTVLFVSHNMGSIATLCNRGILLQFGSVKSIGDITPVLQDYISTNKNESEYVNKDLKKGIYFSKVSFFNSENMQTNNLFLVNSDINIKIDLFIDEGIDNANVSIIVKDIYENPIFSSHFSISKHSKGLITVIAKIKSHTLLPSTYKLEPVLHVPNVKFLDKITSDLTFEVEDSGSALSQYNDANLGKVNIPINWSIKDK